MGKHKTPNQLKEKIIRMVSWYANIV